MRKHSEDKEDINDIPGFTVDPTLSMTHYEDATLGSDYTLKQSFSRSRVLFGGKVESKNTRSAA